MNTAYIDLTFPFIPSLSLISENKTNKQKDTLRKQIYRKRLQM